VTYQNTGGATANTVDGVLSFNGYAGVTSSDPATIASIAGSGATAQQVFTVTLATTVASGTFAN